MNIMKLSWIGRYDKTFCSYAHYFDRNWQLPFLNQWRERMTLENISWSNFHEKILPTRRRSNLQPPDHQSDAHPTGPPITKTYLYNIDPLKPHFYKENWGLQGYTLIFLFLRKNIDFMYSLEPPRYGANENPQSMLRAEIWKKKSDFFIWKFSVSWKRNFLYIWIGVFS